MRIRLSIVALVLILLSVSVLAQRVATESVTDGTAGDVILNGSEPGLTTFGVVLKGKAGTPSVGAKLATSDATSAFVVFSSANTNLLRVNGNGNVGIGTATPTAKLQVAGSMQVDRQLTIPGWVPVTTQNTYGYVKLITPIVHNEWNMFHIDIRGYPYVSGPDPINIRCTGYAFGGGSLINHSCETNGTDMPVEIGVEQRTGAPAPVVVIRIGTANTGWYFPNFMAEYTGWNVKSASDFVWAIEPTSPALSGNTNNLIANDRNGTLQLGAAGTGAGTNRLTVNGNVAVTGNIAATGNVTGIIHAVYQDIAEWVPASGDVRPGTVVVVNEATTNAVLPSTRAYDTAVAGVVSPQPGVILGFGGPDKAQIATTGRVRVRVDATQRPVRVGDILVTSDKPGTAMVSEPMDLNGRKFHQPGTILGKALEPLAEGEGEILVLLSLQ